MAIYLVKPFISITEDDLKDVTPVDQSFEEKLNYVRRSVDGNLALIAVHSREIGSVKELDGSIYAFDSSGHEIGRVVDVEKLLVTQEWVNPDSDGDGILTETELSFWQKLNPLNWF